MLFIANLLFAWIAGPAAWFQSTDHSGDESAIRALFDRIGTSEDRVEEFVDSVDIDQMFEAMLALASLEELEDKEVSQFKLGLSLGMKQMPEPSVSISGAGNVQRIDLDETSERATVISQCADGNRRQTMRWWLSKREDTWRFVDWEDVEISLRVSVVMSTMLSELVDGESLPPWIESMKKLHLIGEASILGDFDAVEEHLNQMVFEGAPDQIRALEHLTRGGIHMFRGEYEETLECANKAERLYPDLPVLNYQRAISYSELGMYMEALPYSEKHLELIPDEFDMHEVRVECYEFSFDFDSTLGAYRDALKHYPDHVEFIAGLAFWSGDDDKSEFVKHLKSLETAPDLINALAMAIIDYQDLPSLGAAVNVYREIAPDDPDTMYYTAWWHQEEGRLQDAISALKPAMDKLDGREDEAEFQELLWSIQTRAGQALMAYRDSRDPAFAFKIIALELYTLEDWEVLSALLKASEARESVAKRSFYVGVLLRVDGDPNAAAEFFADRRGEYLDDEWIELFEMEILRAFLEANRFDEALEEAQRSTERDDDPYFEFVVHVRSGDVKEAIRVAEALVELEYDISQLYEEPILREFLTRKSMEAFRRLFPPVDEDKDERTP